MNFIMVVSFPNSEKSGNWVIIEYIKKKKTIFNQWRTLKSLGIQINAGLNHSLIRINLKAKKKIVPKNGLIA